MGFLKRNIICVICITVLMLTGCTAKSKVEEIQRPAWDPVSGKLTSAPEISRPDDGNEFQAPTTPFNTSDFIMELSLLSSHAASDIAALKAEAEIGAAFPSEAAAMLEEVADTLRTTARTRYTELELALVEEYGTLVDKVGSLEDNIRLGKSMEYVYGRDVVGYYQLNSTKINEMKKAYWQSKLRALREELAAERSRFHFAKLAKLLSKSAEISVEQRREIDRLEHELEKLAMGYASRVKDAIAKAGGALISKDIAANFVGSELDKKMEEFDTGIQESFERAKLITGR